MKIVIIDGEQLNPGDLSWSSIEHLGEVSIYSATLPDEVLERCEGAEVVVTNKVPFDQERISALPNLKCIIVSATGYNIIDIDAAKEQGIIVCNAPSYSNESVAQHVFALILAIYNKVETYADEVRQGKWTKIDDWSYTNEPLENLQGKILGILGFGQIGQKVSEIALAFGMKVIAHHKHPKRDARPDIGFVDMKTLFETSDILTLHVPLNESTRHIVNSENLDLMKESAIIVNTGRGPLVDEYALAKALTDKRLKGAGLDVLSNEPPKKDNPLFACANCYITPHLAWAGLHSRKKLMGIVEKDIEAYQNGKPINQVN